jgi:Tfp pilus assembly protein PilO
MKKIRSADLIIIIVIVIIVAAAVSLLLYQQVDRYISLSGAINQEKKLLSQDEMLLGQLEKLSGQKEQLIAYDLTYKKLVPDLPDESGLISTIQDIAADVMAEFIQVKFDPRVKGAEYMEMPMVISFAGSYDCFISFIDELRNCSRALRIDSINVGLAGEEGTKIKADINMVAFYKNTDK